MPHFRIGLLEVGRQRLRARGIEPELEDKYIGHMQDYLRFYNDPVNAARLATLDAHSCIENYLDWLGRQGAATPQELLLARSAIELLYSDVFRIPLTRS